ncbi:MAG: NAD-dependent succinate-semialdehyde dehydrogenase [Candidatus Sumerlaeia bacterium]|nr:NAD-dependent succinate-semialdehyde dehydrogenase [Candidatus Sumerlaeia bacterium]
MQLHRLYLNGAWSAPAEPLDVINPATGQPFARVATCRRDDVRRALEVAGAAWPAWRALSGKQRGAYLLKIADILQRRSEEIARTITLENGKPLAQSRGEVAMAVDHIRWFAAEAERAYGRIVPPQVAGKRHMVVRSPIGVVGAISPWNFPLVLAMRKVAPALAAGCPVILKPASATPVCAVQFAEAVHEAQLPAGVFQLVVGPSNEIGAEFLDNPICRKITFTGSTEVGRRLIAGAGSTLTKLSLELGGHAPVLVFDDADFDQAVEGTLIAKFRNTGQSCIAANRVYVQRGIADKFIAALVERTRALQVGNGLDDGVEIGPLINRAALEQALDHIEEARARGARVLCGGRRWAGSETGFFLEPTILADVPADALCMREETFAPVAPVCVFDSDEEAVAQANATRYGLAAYAFTNDLSRVWRLAETLEAGTIGINDTVPATSQCPFGGLKESGWGRELGIEGLDAFLETKHISIRVKA